MSDGIEEAIVALVIRGDAEAEQASNRIEADLTSVERAGKRAEAAAGSAEQAAKQLVTEATHALHTAVRAMHMARLAAKAFGADETSPLSGTLEVGIGAGSGAIQGARLGAFLGPEGALGGALLGGALGGINSFREYQGHVEEKEKRDSEVARKVVDELHRRQDLELGQELLNKAGLAKLGALLRNP